MAAGILSVEQLQRLIETQLERDEGAGGMDANRFVSLASRTAEIFDAAAAIMVRRGGHWSLDAHSPSEPHFQSDPDDADAFTTLVDAPPSSRVKSWTDADDEMWTLIVVPLHPPAIIAVHGDWMPSSQQLSLWARCLAVVWQAGVTAARARSRRIGHRLARSLARANGLPDVCNTIARTMAGAVKARLAALAVPTLPGNHLAIMATYGYSLELVKHLRIKPGAGVIGSVFESGRIARETTTEDGSDAKRRRPRYRTDSFIALPIRSGAEVLGVMCVTDRIDNRPFTREDASTLRALAAPAALALARERALVQMRQFAHGSAVDPLSGSFNRRHFQARLQEELERSRRDHIELAILMVDIDDFKSINDSFGHLVGDTLIKDVAEILRRSVRVFDVCARFGGDEFAVLMPASTVESAAKVAERIRERIETSQSLDSHGQALRVTASVGLAMSSPAASASDIIARADEALYVAKREGKNRLRILPLETTDRVPRPAEV
jgi:diguanylate cyclase (GGDEF)-like protein